MEQEFELIAKTFMGLEPVLAKELTEMGANNVQVGRRMVSFTGNKEMMYRANFQLHTAIRILKPIAHFKASSAEDMYEEVKKIDWVIKKKTSVCLFLCSIFADSHYIAGYPFDGNIIKSKERIINACINNNTSASVRN